MSVSVRRLVQNALVLLLLASGLRVSVILGSGSSSRRDGLLLLDWLPGFRAVHDHRGFLGRPAPRFLLWNRSTWLTASSVRSGLSLLLR